MVDERFPNWDIDVENGTVYSLKYKKYIGSIDEKGYIQVEPPKGYKSKEYLHRIIWMVANQADILEGYQIHHINGNKLDNRLCNLELIEQSKHISIHNKEHKRMLGKYHTEESKLKMSKSQINNLKKSKKVMQLTLDGELIKIWCSANECGRNGYNQGHVSACCRGELKNYKNFIWKYYNEERDVA